MSRRPSGAGRASSRGSRRGNGASRFENGSSSRRTDGLATTALPSATRCRSPPERARGFRRIRSVSPSQPATSAVRATLSRLGTPRRGGRRRDWRRRPGADRGPGSGRPSPRPGRAGDVIHPSAADRDLSRTRRFEPGDGPQEGGFPRPRRADDDEPLPLDDRQVDPGDGVDGRARVALREPSEFDGGQRTRLP